MKKSWLLQFMSLWPPYVGAGIRVRKMSPDFRSIDVEMKLRFWNQNYVGTHFGGSLFSMVDPFFMLMVMENLGKGYRVWDKAATIRFKKPGRGTVTARFRLTQEQIDSIRAQVETETKSEPSFMVEVKDESGEVIAQVEKLLSVRKIRS